MLVAEADHLHAVCINMHNLTLISDRKGRHSTSSEVRKVEKKVIGSVIDFTAVLVVGVPFLFFSFRLESELM